MRQKKPTVLLLGQTPPPWHGQAVATQILFDHAWPEFDVHRLRMAYSDEIDEVGRFHLRKVKHLFSLICEARRLLKQDPDTILFYPPASANWVPFLRDVAFLACTRHLAAKTIFIFHASGLAEFCEASWLRRRLAKWVYHNADMALEVAEEKVAPHAVFHAKNHEWCPCAIKVPDVPRKSRTPGQPINVLFVGSLQEGKGVLEILKTAAEIKKRNLEQYFHFHLVGKWFSETFEKQAMAMRNDLDLGDSVTFAGQLTGNEKWRAFAEADVFFFPTHYQSEATPIVLMEALGMGLPIISTEWAGVPAMLNGCETARLLPIKEPGRYADALSNLKSDIDQEIDYEKDSKAYYRKHFLPQRFIERVERVVRSTCGAVLSS